MSGSESRPAFVVGALRSGTTLLRLMLDGHPDVCWFGEFDYAVDFLPPGFDATRDPWPDVRSYSDWLIRRRAFLATGFVADAGRGSYGAMLDHFLEQAAATAPETPRVVGMTVHRRPDLLPRIWPEATYVHIVRDPRAVAESWIRMGWGASVLPGADGWRQVAEWWQVVCEQVPDEQRIVIRFEDLVAEPRQELTRIADKLGLPWDPGMLSYPERSTYDAPDPDFLDRHRFRLTPDAIAIVDGIAGPSLAAYGYAHGRDPAVVPSPRLRRRLQARDRIGRLKHRLRRFGPGLVCGEFLARKLRIRKLETRLQRRMFTITDQHLK